MSEVQTPLDRRGEEARRDVLSLVVQGKGFSEIAQVLSQRYGETITDKMVEYFWGKIKPKIEEREEGGKIDVLHELLWLYREQMERVRLLRRLEKEAGMPIPETKDNLALAATILDKIADLIGTKNEGVESKKLKLFGVVED